MPGARTRGHVLLDGENIYYPGIASVKVRTTQPVATHLDSRQFSLIVIYKYRHALHHISALYP